MGGKMKAAIFVEKNRIVLDDKPIPDIGPLDAFVRITTTSKPPATFSPTSATAC